MVLPVNVSQLCASGSPCLSAGNSRFTYHLTTFRANGFVDSTPQAKFNAFSPAISNGMFDVVGAGPPRPVVGQDSR
ncbi:MAG TPA: hypothetical protein VNN79_08240, partial [Actinomycetota bacterium]|nr:hypothetical protein [Actinomycetota bacterium]